MGYQKSNTLKTLNHWQSSNNFKILKREQGQIISMLKIGGEPYYVPPYLRFKNSTFKGLFQSYEGVIDFNNMNLYKGEKYVDTTNAMTRFRGIMSFGSDFLDFEPPEDYPASEYWEDQINFYWESPTTNNLVYQKTNEKQNVIENIIIPKINRVGLFYAWARDNAIEKLPSWVNQFDNTDISFGVSNIMDISDLLTIPSIYPNIIMKGIKLPKESELQDSSKVSIDNMYPFGIWGFAQDNIDLEGQVTYNNGGCYLYKPLRLNPIPLGCLYIGDLKNKYNANNRLGSTTIGDTLYIDDGYVNTFFNYNLYVDDELGPIYIKKEIKDEQGNIIAAYMFTLDNVIEEIKPLRKQTIIKLKW